jgi:DNA-binding MarR family transcriptional regulator
LTINHGADNGGRDTLIAELVEEMTSWSPRERIDAFRSWLKGSLSLIHLHVLTVLEADGPLPMSRLAETLDVSVASAAGIAIFRDMTEHRRQSLTHLFGRLTDDELTALLTGLRAMRNARIALHVEKTRSGLVAVTIPDAGSADAADAAETAATPTVTGGDA